MLLLREGMILFLLELLYRNTLFVEYTKKKRKRRKLAECKVFLRQFAYERSEN